MTDTTIAALEEAITAWENDGTTVFDECVILNAARELLAIKRVTPEDRAATLETMPDFDDVDNWKQTALIWLTDNYNEVRAALQERPVVSAPGVISGAMQGAGVGVILRYVSQAESLQEISDLADQIAFDVFQAMRSQQTPAAAQVDDPKQRRIQRKLDRSKPSSKGEKHD